MNSWKTMLVHVFGCVLSATTAWALKREDAVPSAGCGKAPPKWLLKQGQFGAFSDLVVDDKLLFGERRKYDYHVPGSYVGEAPLPVVFDFHGYYDTAKSEAHEDAVRLQSEVSRFIAIFPRAMADYPKHDKWGSSAWGGPGLDGSYGRHGHVCDAAWSENYPCYKSCEALGRCKNSKDYVDCHSGPCVNDDLFVNVMFEHILKNFCVDRSRAHATGISDGAIFLYGLLGRSRPGDYGASLASVVLVEGSVPLGFLHSPLSPVAVMDIHGTHDHCVPGNASNSYNHTRCDVPGLGPEACTVGDDFYFYTPLAEILAIWGVGNSCKDAKLPFTLDVGPEGDYSHYPTEPTFDGSSDFWCASRNHRSGCKLPIVWCTHNGKHDWPWSPDERKPMRHVHHHHKLFAELMWWFMSQHQTPKGDPMVRQAGTIWA